LAFFFFLIATIVFLWLSFAGFGSVPPLPLGMLLGRARSQYRFWNAICGIPNT